VPFRLLNPEGGFPANLSFGLRRADNKGDKGWEIYFCWGKFSIP